MSDREEFLEKEQEPDKVDYLPENEEIIDETKDNLREDEEILDEAEDATEEHPEEEQARRLARRERRIRERRRRERQLRIRYTVLAAAAMLVLVVMIHSLREKRVPSEEGTGTEQAVQAEQAVEENPAGGQQAEAQSTGDQEKQFDEEQTEQVSEEKHTEEQPADEQSAEAQEEQASGQQQLEQPAPPEDVLQASAAEGMLLEGKTLYVLPREPEEEAAAELKASLKVWAESGRSFRVVPVPSAACVAEGILDDPDTERAALKAVFKGTGRKDETLASYDALRDALSGKGQLQDNGLPELHLGWRGGSFYRTAPYLTARGALAALGTVAEALGIENPSSKCDTILVKSDYPGPLAEASELDLREPLSVLVPAEGIRTLVTGRDADGNLKESPSLYKEKELDSEDPYRVFFGGSTLTRIRATGSGRGRLILVTDRCALQLTALLLPYYREITVVMPGHDLPKGAETLETLAAAEPGAEILVLCGAQTLLNDENMRAFLQNGGE